MASDEVLAKGPCDSTTSGMERSSDHGMAKTVRAISYKTVVMVLMHNIGWSALLWPLTGRISLTRLE